MLLARIDASPQRLGDFRYNALPFEIPWGRVVVPSRSRAAIRRAHRAAGRDTASDRRAGGAAARAVRGESAPEYVCQRERIDSAQSGLPVHRRRPLDDAVGKLLVEAVTPLALEVALAAGDSEAARAGSPAHGPRRPHALRA
jgi:hypothetical protein